MEPAMSDIERLIAINEIREVMARYARFADDKKFIELASLSARRERCCCCPDSSQFLGFNEM